MADATSRGSPPTSVTSDDSMATSVPVPMATPRSACASAGASLMPSPTIATMWPADWISATMRALSAGEHPAADAVRAADGRATAAAAAGVSPDTSHTSMPAARRSRTASAEPGLIGSAMRNVAAWRPSIATRTSVRPSATMAAASRTCAPAIAIVLASSLALPTTTRWPSTVPLTPRPGYDSNPSLGRKPSSVMLARTTIAAPSGCSLPRSTDAARSTTSRSVEARLEARPARPSAGRG